MLWFIIQVKHNNKKKNSMFSFLDQYVALERSTAKQSSIDIEKFLEQYKNYSSVYESWQKLEDYIQVQIKYFVY